MQPDFYSFNQALQIALNIKTLTLDEATALTKEYYKNYGLDLKKIIAKNEKDKAEEAKNKK